MQVSEKEHRVLTEAINQWKRDGVISHDQARQMTDTCEVTGFDWQRLAKYCFWLAMASFVIAVSAILADKWLIALLKRVFDATDLMKCIMLGALSAAFYATGLYRYHRAPEKTYSNEALLFLGVMTTAFAIAYLGKAFDTGSGHFSILLLLASLVYAALGLAFPSKQVWVFGLVSLGSWFGAETGYVSGWGAYYLGMNYPLRFVLFGAALVVAAHVIFSRWPQRETFRQVTHVAGLTYLFIALWILSIFGNYGDINLWYNAAQFELFHWSLLFGIAALAAIVHGIKTDDAASRGFGITFMFINLYTRFFEYFWQNTHKAIFFSILALSFWLLGSKAEKIWTLRFRKRADE